MQRHSFSGPYLGLLELNFKAFSSQKGLVFAVNGASAPPPPPQKNSPYTPLALPPPLSWKTPPPLPPLGFSVKPPPPPPQEKGGGGARAGGGRGGAPRPHLPRKTSPLFGENAFFCKKGKGHQNRTPSLLEPRVFF